MIGLNSSRLRGREFKGDGKAAMGEIPRIDRSFAGLNAGLAGELDYPFYWSSTTLLSSKGTAVFAVYISFGRGLGSMDGVPNDYPSWDRGPQCEVQRVFNYVRLVRTVDRTEVRYGYVDKDDDTCGGKAPAAINGFY